MSREPVGPIPPEDMLGSSDWDDEDLLTVVEATDRISEEIAGLRRRIQRAEETVADGSAQAPGLAAERSRLDELIRAAARIKAAQANAPR